jgi:hypothetical protein
MTQAGTMDMGGSARAKQSGSRWPIVVWTLVVVVATIAAVWFASSAGIVGGTSAKPAADRSFDAIEAQRGAVTLSSERSQYLDGILDRAHAAPYAATLSSERSQALTTYLDGILDRAHATPYSGPVALSSERSRYLDGILDRAHAAPYAGDTAQLLVATSGTFHPGTPAVQLVAPAMRDRVGGP